ncbi:hypothetical protein P3875_01270 [Myroides sp. JBRI-B21084]|uniref:hypothetical protein n=1 Tax=Myroides sp. JBRI-B21084 TaxID=3119977 RepID=UPI0026E27B1A|nr:hypothetical protein [Paenimyroides cloacae]WKW46731.1 hypothetical protein P3875_01270 [Paenimyroides cloacae]
MKQAIFKCNSSIERVKKDALDRIKIYNDLIQILVNKGFKITNENIEMVFSNPKEYVLDQLTNGTGVVINGIKVNVIKAFELLEIPHEIIKIVNELESTPMLYGFDRYTYENGSIVLTTAEVKRIEESATIFAETSEQLEVWNKLNEVASTLNSISNKLKFNNDLQFLSACFGFNSMGNNPNATFKTDPNIINRLK